MRPEKDVIIKKSNDFKPIVANISVVKPEKAEKLEMILI